MGHKKYYGYKKPVEYCSERIQDDDGKTDGSIFAITYYDGKFSMTLLDWGGEAQYERSRDGEVEQVLVFRRREYQETDAAYWYQKWTRPYCRDETPLW